MAKIILNPIVAGYRSLQQYNDDLEAIEAAIENTISRDGSTPNEMLTVFDMNGFEIINLPKPVNPTDVVRLEDLNGTIGGGGPAGGSFQIISSSTTLLAGFTYIITTAGITVTLPPASTVTQGNAIAIGDGSGLASGSPITVQQTGLDTINHTSSTWLINLSNKLVWFISNGTNGWYVVQ